MRGSSSFTRTTMGARRLSSRSFFVPMIFRSIQFSIVPSCGRASGRAEATLRANTAPDKSKPAGRTPRRAHRYSRMNFRGFSGIPFTRTS